MGIKGGPDIITDGLVFNLDAAGAISDKGYPINGLPVEYLIVAGGGGGGGVIGGGGGAGGLLHGYTRASLSTGSYTVTVGAGGTGGTGWNTSSQDGKVGSNSSVFSITSTGGGGGVHHAGNTTSTTKDGGSGGGGAYAYSGQGGTGIAGQGNNGGNSGNGNLGSGGGGAGSVGANRTASYGGNGGLGKYYGYSFGRSLGYDGWFADGGAGGVRSYGGPIDAGVATHGGGNGTRTTVAAGNGSTNTGSGGGGGGFSASTSSRVGGNGGSGVVIIKYKGPQKATGGDSIITRNGYTIHVFTSSGTFTVGNRVGGLSTSKIVGTLNNMGSSNYSSNNRGYFTFDGSNEYITFPLNNPSGDWVHSIVFWMRLNSNQSNISSRVDPFQIGSVNGYSQYSAMDISNNNLNWYFYSNDTRLINTNIFSGQQWYHIGLTYSGGGATSSTKKFYLNSVYTPWNSTSGAVYGNNLAIAGNTTLTIGRDTPRTTAYFPGRIASFRIYNRALSANEVEQNYNATKGRFGL